MNLITATIISLIVLGVSFYPAFIKEYKDRHSVKLKKESAFRLVEDVLAKNGRAYSDDKIYRLRVLPDGRCMLLIFNKEDKCDG